MQYNFVPHTFFNTNKHRPLVRIMDTCKEIIKESLPIRCLEAAFLAIYLTQELTEVCVASGVNAESGPVRSLQRHMTR